MQPSTSARLLITRTIENWRGRYDLTEAEGDILELAAIYGCRLTTLAQERDVGIQTVKGQGHEIVMKTGVDRLGEAVRMVLLEALEAALEK